MDFKADRIMDYAVFSLPDGAQKFKEVLTIQMTSVQSNGTTCSSWVVRKAAFDLSKPVSVSLYKQAV